MTRRKKTGGREKGTPNKITKDIKEAYQHLIEVNIENLDSWLNEVAKNDPAKAMDIMIRLSEYVVPKLNRTTTTNHSMPSIVINEITKQSKDE